MIRIAVAAAVALSPCVVHAQYAVPDLPDMPDIEVDLPEIDLPRVLAQMDPDDDDDSDKDRDQDKDVQEEEENGVRVYRMKHGRIRVPRVRMPREDELDEGRATAQARGNGKATLQVRGPVTFEVRAQGGDIEVVGTDKSQVSITLSGTSSDEVALVAFGDRVEPVFRGRRQLRNGKLRVELPRGSRLDVSSMSGGVSAQKIGEVRVRSLSGDVRLSQVGKSEVQSISGDVQIADAAGPVRLHLVSGRAVVSSAGSAPQLEFQSASGSLDWGGLCGKDCHLTAETVSGDLRLAVDPKSSFELSYSSHSGELRDEVNLTVKRAPRRKYGMTGGSLSATYGRGEGSIEADAFSGNLVLRKK